MEQDQSKPGAQPLRSPLVVSLRESMKRMSPLLLFNYVVYSSPLETLERIMDDAETDRFADTRDTLLARLTELGAWLGEESDQREPGALLEKVLETPLEILERTRTEAEVRHFTEQRERLLAYLEEERALLVIAMSRPPQPPRVRDHEHMPVNPTEEKVYCLICTRLLYRVKVKKAE